MSEAIRSYNNQSSVTRRRRRKGRTRRFLLLAALLVIATAWWVTRDTHALWQLIPAQHKAGILFTDINAQRARLADAAFWPLLPEAWELHDVPGQLRGNFGMPPWVLNNLIGDISYLYADDLDAVGNPVFITRMSPFGTIMESLSRLTSATRPDEAGGLGLRSLPGANIHYAVRGRLIILSPSREALIRTLTIPAEAAWTRDDFQAAIDASRGVDLRVALRLDNDDPMAQFAERGEVAVRFQPLGIEIHARITPSQDAANRLQPLQTATNGNHPLLAPPPGMLELSANFGRRFDETITALADAAGLDTPNARSWTAWALAVHAEGPVEGLPDFPQFVAHLLGPAGPAFALAITDVNPNEVVPVPIIEAALEAGAVQPAAWFATLDPAVNTIDGWERVPQLDETRSLVFSRTIGGNSMTPAIVRINDRLFLSTHLDHAIAAADAAQPVGAPLGQTGNLYLRIEPAQCATAIGALLQPLAALGGLRGHDADSWKSLVTEWRGYVESIQHATALAAFDGDAINATIRIQFATANAMETAP